MNEAWSRSHALGTSPRGRIKVGLNASAPRSLPRVLRAGTLPGMIDRCLFDLSLWASRPLSSGAAAWCSTMESAAARPRPRPRPPPAGHPPHRDRRWVARRTTIVSRESASSRPASARPLAMVVSVNARRVPFATPARPRRVPSATTASARVYPSPKVNAAARATAKKARPASSSVRSVYRFARVRNVKTPVRAASFARPGPAADAMTASTSASRSIERRARVHVHARPAVERIAASTKPLERCRSATSR